MIDFPGGLQAVTYLLIFFDQDTLFPRDEDDDEEMGWPLYVAGFVLWCCWILDFTSWLIICLLYKKSNTCESLLENSALSTIIIRATLLGMYIYVIRCLLMSSLYWNVFTTWPDTWCGCGSLTPPLCLPTSPYTSLTPRWFQTLGAGMASSEEQDPGRE